MATEEHELLVAVNVSVDGSQKVAGFEVSINGRFWVSTEVLQGHELPAAPAEPPMVGFVGRLARYMLQVAIEAEATAFLGRDQLSPGRAAARRLAQWLRTETGPE